MSTTAKRVEFERKMVQFVISGARPRGADKIAKDLRMTTGSLLDVAALGQLLEGICPNDVHQAVASSSRLGFGVSHQRFFDETCDNFQNSCGIEVR